MNKVQIIIPLLLLSLCGFSQENEFENLGSVIDHFYKALSTNDQAARTKAMKTVFIDSGRVTSVIQRTSGSNSSTGPWQDFVNNSMELYEKYKIEYFEEERESEYYLDVASVHSIATQLFTEKKISTEYEQRLWFQFDLAFSNNRWYITNVVWVNEYSDNPIRAALLQDTLWHK